MEQDTWSNKPHASLAEAPGNGAEGEPLAPQQRLERTDAEACELGVLMGFRFPQELNKRVMARTYMLPICLPMYFPTFRP